MCNILKKERSCLKTRKSKLHATNELLHMVHLDGVGDGGKGKLEEAMGQYPDSSTLFGSLARRIHFGELLDPPPKWTFGTKKVERFQPHTPSTKKSPFCG